MSYVALVKPLRVLLAELPALMSAIVRETLSREPDILVVDFSNRPEWLDSLDSLGIDVVVIGDDDPRRAVLPARLLRTSPRLKVLVIATSGRTATLYELHPRQIHLGEVAPETLVVAIRSKAREESY